MVHAVQSGTLEAMNRAMPAMPRSTDQFEDLFESAATSSSSSKAGAEVLSDRILLQTASQPADSVSSPASTVPDAKTSLGDPNVEGWLSSYYAEQQGNNPLAVSGLLTPSFEPAAGAGNNFPTGSVYGPDAIFAQALANQVGNSYANMTGDNAAEFTSQLPGIPTQQAQQEFDRRLALENLERLQSGQPIDTTAYWSDPGPITTGGVTYTAQELGYAGPAQSSGPQPIYISQANQIQGTKTFSVPGYTGTVTGIEPGRYYTLQQLEQAGLKAGQPDAQFNPGSWTETQNA
jgi:hypothetical protein